MARGLKERRRTEVLAKEKKNAPKHNVACGCKMCKPHKHWPKSGKFFDKQQLLEEINRQDYE